MADKKTLSHCLWCHHPILKKSIEFYCLLWTVIGLIFLLMMIWGMFQYKTLGKSMWGWSRAPAMMQQKTNSFQPNY